MEQKEGKEAELKTETVRRKKERGIRIGKERKKTAQETKMKIVPHYTTLYTVVHATHTETCMYVYI